MLSVAQILLLDDESELREEVGDFLRTAGHVVDEAGSIRQFRQYVPGRPYDVMIIDRGLPDGEGLELVAELRGEGVRSGIVVFTTRDASRDRISGYESGADNYLTKPIRLDELAAVVGALVRRVAPRAGWRLDSAEWSLWAPEGEAVRLTAQEHSLLLALTKAPQRSLSRRQILEVLGKDMASYDPRNLDALVLRLRRKAGEVSPVPLPLKTVHGTGYALTQELALE